MTELFWDYYSCDVYKVQLIVVWAGVCSPSMSCSASSFSSSPRCFIPSRQPVNDGEINAFWRPLCRTGVYHWQNLKKISEVTPGGLEFITRLSSRLKASRLKFEESVHFNLSHQMKCFSLCWHSITLDVTVLVFRLLETHFLFCTGFLSSSHTSLIYFVQLWSPWDLLRSS